MLILMKREIIKVLAKEKIPTQIEEETKYFLIPKKFRRGFNFNSSVS